MNLLTKINFDYTYFLSEDDKYVINLTIPAKLGGKDKVRDKQDIFKTISARNVRPSFT